MEEGYVTLVYMEDVDVYFRDWNTRLGQTHESSLLDQNSIFLEFLVQDIIELSFKGWERPFGILGVLAENSLDPINTLDIDMLGPPTLWLPRNCQTRFPCYQKNTIKLETKVW